jgi:hypothetical protein
MEETPLVTWPVERRLLKGQNSALEFSIKQHYFCFLHYILAPVL